MMSLQAAQGAPGRPKPLRVRVLGPLDAERDGSPVALGSPLQRRLLAALAAAGGTTVSTDRLVDVLWGDEPPPSARNSLQSHVARLRDVLGDRGAVVTRPPGYALDGQRVEVDAAAFEAALARAREEVTADPAAAAARLAGALAAWRGDAYAEFADGFARAEAVRLETLRADARRLVATARLRAGDVPGAVAALRQLVAEDPYDEEAAVGLARALAAAGRVPEALDQLRVLRGRLADDLGLDPGPALSAAEQELLSGARVPDQAPPAVAPDRAPPAPALRAPRVTTPTLGRDGERDAVIAALASAPLVTLVGTGGVGKTRLAAVAATEDPGPVGWIELAAVRSGDDLVPATLDALGSGPTPGATNDAAAVATVARWPGLVVLDNCEHLLDAVAALVDAVLARGGPVRLLATSRARLDVQGERVVPVAPFPVPAPGRATGKEPAVRLFVDRVAAAGGPPPSVEEAAAVVAAVDGLPLAIELAAARAATLPVQALLDRLDSHLDVLAGSSRRHGRRQRTLADVVAWSHDLLDDADQTLFRRLSVFPSSFTLDAVTEVCSGAGLEAGATVDGLSRLVEQSMVVRVGEGRYRLLEPLRLFASDLLAGAPEAAAVADRHRDLALAVATRADAAMTGAGEVAAVQEVEAALADLRAAHARAVAQDDLVTVARLASRLYRFSYAQARCDVLAWGAPLAASDPAGLTQGERLRAIAAAVAGAWMSGRTREAQRLGHPHRACVHDDAVDPLAAVTLAEAIGDLAVNVGDLDAGVEVFERAVVLCAALGHPGLESLARSSLAITKQFQGASADAAGLADQALKLADQAAAPSARALALYTRGEVLADPDPEGALQAFGEAITEAAAIRGRFLEGIARTAEVALRGRHGDPAQALERYREALAIWEDAGADGLVLTTLRNLVVLLARVGSDVAAVTLHTAVDRLATRAPYGAEARRLAGAAAAASERLDPAALAGARRDGADLRTLADATRAGLEAITSAIAPAG